MANFFIFIYSLCLSCLITGCSYSPVVDDNLSKHVLVQLIDWHISGLWVINSPVAWVKVTNYNPVPIENIVISYETFNIDGKKLNQAQYTIEEVVAANKSKNFIEQYLGLVDLDTEKLKVSLIGVSRLHQDK